MPESSRRHEEAAARHEQAAKTHERSAGFWEQHGDDDRVDLHRDAAAHERAGAALERRWADLISAEMEEGAVRQGGDGPRARGRVEDWDADVENREIERPERVRHGEERQGAALRRDQAVIERKQQASEPNPQYRGSRPGRNS
jgi:hypothetical protein